MTVTPAETFPLGPGTLNIGMTGTPIDVSCLINNAVIAADKDEGDAVTKLCGDVVPGAVTYTYTLSGNIDLDIAEESGLWALSQSSAGQQVDFTYVPNSDAGTEGSGTLALDPLPFGGEDTGETMAGDFEFTIVGAPTYVIGDAEAFTAPIKVRGVPYKPAAPTPARKAPTAPASKGEPVGADA